MIQDPATGTGGFLISADHYVRSQVSEKKYKSNPPRYEGVEIEKGTYRICLMNAFLHRLESHLILGDALTKDAEDLSPQTSFLQIRLLDQRLGALKATR